MLTVLVPAIIALTNKSNEIGLRPVEQNNYKNIRQKHNKYNNNK